MLNDFFWVDKKRDIVRTYEDLLKDINTARVTRSIIKDENTYNVFLSIVVNIVHDIDSVIVDHDFSGSELEKINIKEESIQEKIVITENRQVTYENIRLILQNSLSKSKINLFTSGTTGVPKKVEHTLENLVRNVRMSEKHEKNVWGFAYNPTHFAGLQVFFQAFMNRNMMVNIFDVNPLDIENILLDYNVTNISATPTFYRTLTPSLKKENSNILHLTLGGEKFDENIKEKLSQIFYKAKFHNIYASTEAGSLLISNGDTFKIPERFKSKIKVSIENELLIHKSLLGASESLKLNNNWYHTGDIIERTEGEFFKIKGRDSEVINVGGYNVNPNEVEELIRRNNFVVDVIVKGRPNKLIGNIIIAEIVKLDEVEEPELRNQLLSVLNENLQSYKVPRIFTFVEKIDKSRTGKIKRK